MGARGLCFQVVATVLCLGLLGPVQAQQRPAVWKTWKLTFIRDGNLWIAHGDGSSQRLIVRHAASPCWSPDRKRIAFLRAGSLYLVGADGTHLQKLLARPVAKGDEEDLPPWSVAWSPTGNQIVVSFPEQFTLRNASRHTRTLLFGRALVAVSLTGKPPLPKETLFSSDDQGAGYAFSDHDSPALSPDGKYLAFARNGDIWVAYRGQHRAGRKGWDAWEWDTSRLAAVARFDEPNWRASRENCGVTRLSWSPDGRSLAYSLSRLGGSGTAEVHVLQLFEEIKGYLKVVQDRQLPSVGIQACFSPDGKYLIYHQMQGDNALYAVSIDGKQEWKLLNDATQPSW